jgi:hypothetical protein
MSATHTVWVLAIDHRHGTDITAYGSEEAARSALAAYVDQWWEELADRDAGTLEPPDDRDEMIDNYFEAAAEWSEPESYRLESNRVTFPDA